MTDMGLQIDRDTTRDIPGNGANIPLASGTPAVPPRTDFAASKPPRAPHQQPGRTSSTVAHITYLEGPKTINFQKIHEFGVIQGCSPLVAVEERGAV